MSLAIIEKRPQQRSAGCTGIFFHILDWNRKFAKKKLFYKKLLPPVRTVKSGDEKLLRPKLMLIADENRGGFPKKGDADEMIRGNVMRAPGLVARLMGLDSVPVIDDEKNRKALNFEHKSGDFCRVDQDLCHDVGGEGKLESCRPQKLQKTGNAVRFSTDVVHRNVVARSRKQQHKLAVGSSAKSPRLLSRGNQALLMQAATKILEPGLQPRRRRRNAMICNGISESSEHKNDAFIGSCRSCGNTVEFSQLVSNNDVEDNKVHKGTTLLDVQAKFDTHGKVRDSMERKQHRTSDHVKCKPPKAIDPMVGFKSKTMMRTALPMSRDNLVQGPKFCSRRQIDSEANEFMGGSKHFVGAKKNLNSSPRLKSPSKTSGGSNRVSMERNVWETSAARKRRSSSTLQTDNITASNTSFMKQRRAQGNKINRKESGLIYGHAINSNRATNEPPKRVNVETLSSGDTGIVSFTFSSPMKHKSLSFVKEATSEKNGHQMKPTNDALQSKMLVLNAKNDILSSPRGKCSLRGDKLSNLLEEKIRELNSLDQADVGIKDISGRSTASILEELISALTAGEFAVQSIRKDAESEVSTPKDNFIDSFSMLSNITANGRQDFDTNQKFQVGANPFNAASVVSDSNHPSPISIFDASFSSESCSVGSFNGGFDMKENKTREELKHKCNKTESLGLDYDFLLNSTNSAEFSMSDNEKILSSGRSEFSIHSIQSYDVGILGTKVSSSNEAISKTKLLLESILFFDSDNTLQSSVNLFLVDIFTSISDEFFTRLKSSLILSEADDYNHIKDFLFDFLIESLASRFNQFCICGYKIWLKLPMLLSKNQLLEEIYGEIGRLMELSGKVLNDLAEQELTTSTIRWETFEAEDSLTAMDIESAMLKELIDEMVVDLFCDVKAG